MWSDWRQVPPFLPTTEGGGGQRWNECMTNCLHMMRSGVFIMMVLITPRYRLSIMMVLWTTQCLSSILSASLMQLHDYLGSCEKPYTLTLGSVLIALPPGKNMVYVCSVNCLKPWADSR